MTDVIVLDPGLIERNALINRWLESRRHDPDALPWPSAVRDVSGTIHQGVNEVTAHVVPGEGDTITVSFSLVVPSVLAATFDGYRDSVAQFLGDRVDADTAAAAGVAPQPPPPAASRMADYARILLDRLVQTPSDGAGLDAGRRFNTADCEDDGARASVGAIRGLSVARLEFRGTLTVGSGPGAQPNVVGTVPVTVVVFDDGYTVPFAGYSDNLALDLGETPTTVALPKGCWSPAD